MPALSDHDKGRCRRHLGYLALSSGSAIAFGLPMPVQTLFILEQAMNLLLDDQAVEYCQKLLHRCDELEETSYQAAKTGLVAVAGKLTLHPQGRLGTDNIDREYHKQVGRLADHLGVPRYPFSERNRRTGPGSMIPVRH